MKKTRAQFIDVDALRVGMYVYLDLGWMGHPFARNDFRIGSEDQIATIRGLGVQRLRWSPEQSDLAPTAESAPNEPEVGVSPLEERRRVLLAQRRGLERCEQDFSDATRLFRDLVKLVTSQPHAARERAEAMVSGLVGRLREQGESFIRLLSEGVGERASLHAINVTLISLLLGKRLGLDADALGLLGLGALLHDIGKIELPERLRWRDDDLTAAERSLFQQHVAHGVELAARMGLGVEVCTIIAQHHECVDGSGFPRQLSGDELSYASRIVALVNRYDQVCNPANPAAALTPHNALSLMFAQSKQQFDPAILGSFIRMMGVYPPGSVVLLTDGRYALVVSVSSERPLKPKVIVHDPRVPREEALVVDLESQPELGIRQSLKPLQLPRAVFDYLSPRRRMCYFFERAREPSSSREDR